jgi:peroxidase
MSSWKLSAVLLVIGLAGIASQNCPYQQPTYSEDTAYYSGRPHNPVKSLFPDTNAKFLYDANQGGNGENYKHSQQGYTTARKFHCPKIGGLESHCRPGKDCAIWYDLVRKTPGTSCTLENGHGKGICCPGFPRNGK